MKYYYGVDLGGTDIKIGLFDDHYRLIETIVEPTPQQNQDQTVLLKIHGSIIENIEKNNFEISSIIGIGIAVPSPLKDGIALTSANIKFRKNKNIKLELENMFHYSVKVKVGNDASLAALGEYKVMNSSYKNICFYTLGTGIGGGIIIDGKLLEGERGGAGEFGHMQLLEHYPIICGCGKSGCLEQLSGTHAIVSHCSKLLETKASVLLDIKNITPKQIFDAAKLGDEVAITVVDRMTYYIALSATNLSTILDPEVYIIGGGISNAGSFLIDRIQGKYKELSRFNTGEIPFVLAQLGNKAGIYGAAYLVGEDEKRA